MKMIIGTMFLTFAAVASASDDVDALDAKVVSAYMQRHDANHDGKVSVGEYQDWEAIKQHAPHLESGARKGFAERDLNHDGYLDAAEVKAMLASQRAAQRAPHD